MLLVFTLLTAVMTYPQVLHLHDGVQPFTVLGVGDVPKVVLRGVHGSSKLGLVKRPQRGVDGTEDPVGCIDTALRDDDLLRGCRESRRVGDRRQCGTGADCWRQDTEREPACRGTTGRTCVRPGAKEAAPR